MADITRIDTDGVRSILEIGQLAVDNYADGEDVGRLWTGNGDVNRKLAFHDEMVTTVAGKTGTVVLDKIDVGLNNVDNTSDANKPVSIAVDAELDELRGFKEYVESMYRDTNEPSGYVRERPASMGVMELTAQDGLVHRIDQYSVYTVSDTTKWYDGSPISEHQFRIMPTEAGSPIEIWQQGKLTKFESGKTVQLAANGSAGVLVLNIIDEGLETEYAEYSHQVVIDMDFFEENPITAWIQFSGDGSTVVQFGDERHGISMSGATHYYLHMTEGTRYHSGLGIQGLIIGGTTHGVCEAGALFDEDIINELPNCDTPRWMTRENSMDWALSSVDQNIGHMNNGVAQYNKYDSGTDTWSMVNLVSGEYTYVFYVATNNKLSCFIKLTAQDVYQTETSAQDGLDGAMAKMNLQGLPAPEVLICGAWIVNSSGELVSYHGSTHIDLRQQRISGAAGSSGVTTDHRNLTHTDAINSHTSDAISVSIPSHGDVATVTELGVDLYNKIDNINVSGGSPESKTYDELIAITPTDNTMYWYIDAEKYVYGNARTGTWKYFNDDRNIKKDGTGTGGAGTWTESWEADITIIIDKWFSNQLAISNDGSSGGMWNKHDGSTGSSSTGPNSAYDGQFYMYTETSSSGHEVDFQINTTEFSELTEVNFMYHAYGSSMGTVSLDALSNGMWTTYWTVSGDQGNAWHNQVVNMSGSMAEEIRFRHHGATSYRADFAIDKIQITSI